MGRIIYFTLLAIAMSACASKGPVVYNCEEAEGMLICRSGDSVCTRHEDQSLVCVQ